MSRRTISHRAMLFSFLGDERLDKAQRAVGTVLILFADANHKFVSRHRYHPMPWDKISLLSGYTEKKARQVLNELAGLGWMIIRTRQDGASLYQIAPDRFDAAWDRMMEYHQRRQHARDTSQPSAPSLADDYMVMGTDENRVR